MSHDPPESWTSRGVEWDGPGLGGRRHRLPVGALRSVISSVFARVTDRWLATGYIAVIGVLLSLGVVTQLILAVKVTDFSVLGPVSGLLPVLLFLFIGYWLTRSELAADNVLAVAKWGGVAIALLTLVNSGIVLIHRFVTPILTPGLTMLVSNVAVGGIIGLVFGWMRELDRTARSRFRKTTVLNRTLRHDLRNDVNVALGALEVLEAELPPANQDRLEVVRDRIRHLETIGDHARSLQAAVEEPQEEHRPVDISEILRTQLDTVRRDRPEVAIEADLEPETWVRGNDSLPVLFANLVENAIEHNEGHKRLAVSVAAAEGSETVVITVDDNGPGIPEAELAVLDNGHETPLEHSSGTGLWLVTWLASSYGGAVSFSTGSAGTTVQVELPRASPADQLEPGDPALGGTGSIATPSLT